MCLAQWMIHEEDKILVFLRGEEGIAKLDKDRRIAGNVSPGAKEQISIEMEE